MADQCAVFLCRGGETGEGGLGYRRLLWTAEAKAARVWEVDQACQAEGGQAIARWAAERGRNGLVLAACPRALVAGGLGTALAAAGVGGEAMRLVDAYLPPERAGGPCPVRPGAVASLLQALAVAARQAPLVSQEWPVANRALVLGDGLAALTCVVELSRAGHAVTLLTPTRRLAPTAPGRGEEAQAAVQHLCSQVESLPGVEILRRARLLSLSGTAGAFTARIQDIQRQGLERQVGAALMALAPPMRLNLPPGAPPSPRLVSMADLWALLSSPEHFRIMVGGSHSPRVGLALGMDRQAWPPDLRSACLAARELLSRMQAQVTLFTRQAKVAAPDLEELSQAVRGEGAIFVKLTRGALSLEPSPSGGLLAHYPEEILDRQVRQELDLLAVDETPAPDQAWQRSAAALGLEVGGDGRLQPDLMAAMPLSSGRGGVWALGPARSGADWTTWQEEARAAAAQVRLLLDQGRRDVAGRVKVDRGRCAVCLTCVRVCPQGAMGRLERRPFSNPLVCTACGACASECPMDAIQIIGHDDQRYGDEMEAARAPAGGMLELEPGLELLVLACANSAVKALRGARLAGGGLPPGVRLVEVPCAGKIDPAYLLKAFNLGMDGVLTLFCHPGACQSLGGDTWAGWRLEHLRGLLTEAGLGAERLMRGHLAPLEPASALPLLEDALARLRQLGPSPLKMGGRVRDFLGRFAVQVDHTYVIL